jgi:hypothetical protein
VLVNPDIQAWFDKLQGRQARGGSAPRGQGLPSAPLEGIVQPGRGMFGFNAPSIAAKFQPRSPAPYPGQQPMRGIPPVAPSSSGGGGRDLGGGAIAAGLGKLGQGIEQGLGEWKAQQQALEAARNPGYVPMGPVTVPTADKAGALAQSTAPTAPTFQPVGPASETPTFAQPGGGGGAMGSSIGPASTSLPTFAQGAPTTSTAGNEKLYQDAIANIESKGSGDYNAVNSKTGALGRYQVMPKNLPGWSQAALGKTITPQEFIASPQAQDAVFNKVFGGYVDKYGPTGASNTWFTGRPNPPATANDGTTTAPQYAAKFNAYLSQHGGETPAPSAPSAAAYAALPPISAEPAVASSVTPGKPQDPNNTRGIGVNGTPYDASGKYVGYESSADTVAPAAPASQPPLLNGGQPGVYSAPQIGPQGMNDQANPLAAALAQGGQQGPQLDQSALLALALAQNQPDFSTPDLGGFFG